MTNRPNVTVKPAYHCLTGHALGIVKVSIESVESFLERGGHLEFAHVLAIAQIIGAL